MRATPIMRYNLTLAGCSFYIGVREAHAIREREKRNRRMYLQTRLLLVRNRRQGLETSAKIKACASERRGSCTAVAQSAVEVLHVLSELVS
jgi:hypothetical protein